MLTVQDFEHSIARSGPATGSREGHRLVIEFAGPTGAGKTTNCRRFSETLISVGLKTYQFKDVKKHLYRMPFFRRFLLYLRTVLNNRDKLWGYCRLLAANGALHPDAMSRYVKLCIFNTAAQDFLKSRCVDVLLLDQWTVQGLWSATIFRAKAYASLEERLPQFCFDASYLLFFDADEETACQRIASRTFGRSRFDRMDAPTRLAEMKCYNAYLRALYEHSACRNKLVFSARKDPQENAETFLKHLQQALQQENH